MPSLRFNKILLLLLLTACRVGHYNGLKPYEGDKEPVLKPIFEDRYNSYLFKANIKLYTKSFSGLLLTKQTEQGTYRVIFTTEMGMKLFDFEVNQEETIVHYSVPQFDRPLFMKTIQKDMELLLMNGLKNKTPEVFKDKEGRLVHKFSSGDEANYYFQEEDLMRIEHTENNKQKIVFTLDNHTNGFPENISIQHYGFRLKIDLTNLKKS
ncbi:hypothetical protein DJ013_13690 [Arcticibacterium luteifluviistationis]|uniref:DUF4292 domain-containing protein n=1 Tax=Arcticibacterium luteifluviistationis TaxID=1784714 RepID=A0A2Z4GDD6_9BACT|nr:hypothetical protein DJ013_13690 [Arcticibacterium luteifluviistationis]